MKEVRRADGTTNQLYWRADSYAVDGRINGETYGNGVTNDRVYDKASGRLTGAGVGLGSGNEVQFLAYTYDQIGNVLTRNDGPTARNEVFVYDTLDRLTSHALDGSSTVTVSYDAKGNILSKSDVGTYTYGGPRPHAVTQAGANSYSYDNNGNMTAGAGRTITWTSFNQARTITQGAYHATFSFGAAHERVKQVAHNGTTLYVGGLWEKFTNSTGATLEKNYILAPTGRIAVATFGTGAPVGGKLEYFHTDGLGSITAVTDTSGAVVKRFAYDAWGKRINPTGGAAITSTTNGSVVRGFTDHEHLDDLGLIHMNGRVYDPVLGRFLSADPFVDGAYDSQGYNRYSYVGNNPMNATDPSGFIKLKDILPAIVAVVVTAVSVVVFGPSGLYVAKGFWSALGAGLSQSYAIGAAAVGGFAGGFSGSLLNGGSIGEAFKAGVVGAAVGAATAWAAQGVGSFFEGAAKGSGFFSDSTANWGGRTLAHGVVGGAASEFHGGEFRHGFYASAASAGFMHSSAGRSLIDHAHIAARTATAAVIGGTVSVIGGGKFANGAITSAFQHLFNSEATRPKEAEGVLFLRLNYLDSTEKVDSNAKAWRDLIIGLKNELLADDTIKGHQLNFAMARTEAEAVKYLQMASDRKLEVILSSHGHPSNADYKSMFGKNIYTRQDFIRNMNNAIGSDILSGNTTWYSCDAMYGTRTPTQIFNEDAKSHISWRLTQITSRK